MTPRTRAAEIHALLTRLADGDRTAIEPAFSALWPIMRRFSLRALGGDADAEDAAQVSLMKLFAQAADFDSAKDGLAWALTIASYECRSLRRKAHRRRENALEPHAALRAAGDVTPEEAAIERDLEAAAREVLGTMSEEDVATILASLADARPASATFRKRLQRAIARLRYAWRDKHEAE